MLWYILVRMLLEDFSHIFDECKSHFLIKNFKVQFKRELKKERSQTEKATLTYSAMAIATCPEQLISYQQAYWAIWEF